LQNLPIQSQNLKSEIPITQQSAISNLQSSIQVASQLACTLRPPQFVFRARFNLANTLARDAERVANLLQRPRLAVAIEPEAERDDLALLVVEIVERLADARRGGAMDQLVLDVLDRILLDQVPELRAF